MYTCQTRGFLQGKHRVFLALTNWWTLKNRRFSVLAFGAHSRFEKMQENSRKHQLTRRFVTRKLWQNNGKQFVFKALTMQWTPVKQLVFLLFTVVENCRIMERILEFTVRKANGKPRILRSENSSECTQNVAFYNVNRSFSKQVNATFFAVDLDAIVELRMTMLLN